MPEGVGMEVKPDQPLFVQMHYLNASDSVIKAASAVNFHTTNEADIDHLAGDLGMYNFAINIPAGQTGSFTKSCSFSKDVMLFKLTRHTHEWGTDFPVSWDGGPNDGELIYTSPNYEDPDYLFPEPVLVEAGTGLEWTCNYNNTTNGTLRFGVKATDEMCILFGQFYDPVTMETTDEGCF